MNKIDLALAIMCATAKPDETLSTYEIASICGCQQSYISEIARNALKKLRGNLGIELRDFYEDENIDQEGFMQEEDLREKRYYKFTAY